MRQGNRLGLLGLAALALVAVVQFSHRVPVLVLCALLQWTAIGLCTVAGIVRPRIWLLVPLAIVAGVLYLLSLGHGWT